MTDLFRVESTTGVVRVSGNVRFSETGIRSYNLSVLARDRGSPAQFSSVSLAGEVLYCVHKLHPHCMLKLHPHGTISIISNNSQL